MRELGPAVDDSVSDDVHGAEALEDFGDSRCFDSTAGGGKVDRGCQTVVGLEQTQLETTRACVGDQNPHGGSLPGPVANLGGILTFSTRMGARLQSPIHHELPHMAGT